jgi:hypothetical protein
MDRPHSSSNGGAVDVAEDVQGFTVYGNGNFHDVVSAFEGASEEDSIPGRLTPDILLRIEAFVQNLFRNFQRQHFLPVTNVEQLIFIDLDEQLSQFFRCVRNRGKVRYSRNSLTAMFDVFNWILLSHQAARIWETRVSEIAFNLRTNAAFSSTREVFEAVLRGE